MSFSFNPEIEPQQGCGKLDALVNSGRGTSTFTTHPNCFPDVFFSRLIWFGRNHKCRSLSNMGERFPWVPNVLFSILFSSSSCRFHCPVFFFFLKRTNQSFIPVVLSLWINSHNADAVWMHVLWCKCADLQGIRECAQLQALHLQKWHQCREWMSRMVRGVSAVQIHVHKAVLCACLGCVPASGLRLLWQDQPSLPRDMITWQRSKHAVFPTLLLVSGMKLQ